MSMQWNDADRRSIAQHDEVGIASYRADGTLRNYVTIWAVEADGRVYVRSAYGADNPWYRRALTAGRGSIQVDGIAHDVEFVPADAAEQAAVDEAYRSKYAARYASIVDGITAESVHDVTLRLELAG
jgi:hypothetical protein